MSTTNIHDNGHFCAGNHSFDRTEFGLKVKVGATSCGCLFTAPGVSAACFFRERVSPLWGDTLGGDTANSKRGGQSFKFALGKLLLHRQSAVKFEELSHSSQGVVKPV